LNKPVFNSTVYVDAVRWEAGGRSQSIIHQHTQNLPTHCCLPEDRVSAAAFHQLFYELFDSIHRVTGQKLKLRPFFPDANGRIIMLDGEVAQALASRMECTPEGGAKR
jgi:hypothetical protein